MIHAMQDIESVGEQNAATSEPLRDCRAGTGCRLPINPLSQAHQIRSAPSGEGHARGQGKVVLAVMSVGRPCGLGRRVSLSFASSVHAMPNGRKRKMQLMPGKWTLRCQGGRGFARRESALVRLRKAPPRPQCLPF